MDSTWVKKSKFSQEWLKNENYKSWIREVPDNNSLYFCAFCNKTFSCSSRVSKHAESESHKKNMLCPEETKTTGEARKREFCHSWFENKQFKS